MILVAFVIVLLGAGAVGYQLFRRQAAAQQAAREAAFADLSQCMLGKIEPDAPRAAEEMTWLSARAAPLADVERWPESGVPWPQRCQPYGRALLGALEWSTMTTEARSAVGPPAFDLQDQLGSPDAHRADLGPYVEALWRQAHAHGLQFATESGVVGPPRAELERTARWLASIRLPFRDFAVAYEGPTWHFTAQLNEDPDKIASCSPSETGLRCTKYVGDHDLMEYRHPPRGSFEHRLMPNTRFFPHGSWESPAYIQHIHSGSTRSFYDRVGVVHHGTVVQSPWYAGHVDASGTAFGLMGDGTLHVQNVSLGEPEEVLDLPELMKIPIESSNDSTIIGRGIAVTVGRGTAARRKWFPLTSALHVGAPVDIPDGKFCRAGSHYVFQGATALSFVDATTMVTAGVVPVEAREWPYFGLGTCRASGTVTGVTTLCRAELKSCVRLPDAMATWSSDTIGDRIFYASEIDGGLVVHLGGHGFSTAFKDVLALPSAGPAGGPEWALFGGERSGLIVAELRDGLMGARVTIDGDITPIDIQWQ